MPSVSTVNIFYPGPTTKEVTLDVTSDGHWTKVSGNVMIGAAEGKWKDDRGTVMFFFWRPPPDHFQTGENVQFMNLTAYRPKNSKAGDEGLAVFLEGRSDGFPTDAAGRWKVVKVNHGEKSSSAGTEEDVRRMQFAR
jgi:hypothetical protein